MRKRFGRAARIGASDVRCQPVDDGIAPLGGLNPGTDVFANLPIQIDQRRIDCLKGSLPRDIDESLMTSKPSSGPAISVALARLGDFPVPDLRVTKRPHRCEPCV